MKQKINYYVFIPSGNDTALVEGLDFNRRIMKSINDEIMRINHNVEQVGFVDKNKKPELMMAGGEFCGNATRSATHYYLDGKKGEIEIQVSGVKRLLRAGIDDNGNAWSQMPIISSKDVVQEIDPGIYKVTMEGIIHIILEVEKAKQYLGDNDKLKETAKTIIDKYDIKDTDAIGVMFLEKIKDKLKLNPVVWVRSIDTLFYETACGSGTVAVGILESKKNNGNVNLELMQPSGQNINAKIICKDGVPVDAYILGKVITDGVQKALDIDI